MNDDPSAHLDPDHTLVDGDGWTRPLEGKFNRARKRARRA
jgi:hypothetical protein